MVVEIDERAADEFFSGADFDPWTVILQAGYYLDDDFEIFARYEHLDFDDFGGNSDDNEILTVGFNKYFSGDHQVKLTTDIGIGFDTVHDAADGDAGWQDDAASDDGQIVLRTQFQLLF